MLKVVYKATVFIIEVYVILGNVMKTKAEEIYLHDAFRSGDRNPEDLFFSIETIYEPYHAYSFDGG